MYDPASVQIHTLSLEETECILRRNHVGRLAFARKNRLTMTPLHYVYASGWLYGRMSAGHTIEELTNTAHNWWPVTFEVDEVEDLFEWRSVVVHGGFSVIDEDSAADPTAEWSRAVEILRTFTPFALRECDPVSDRVILFRISTADISGREASRSQPMRFSPSSRR
jgi:uncharacterized protein